MFRKRERSDSRSFHRPATPCAGRASHMTNAPCTQGPGTSCVSLSSAARKAAAERSSKGHTDDTCYAFKYSLERNKTRVVQQTFNFSFYKCAHFFINRSILTTCILTRFSADLPNPVHETTQSSSTAADRDLLWHCFSVLVLEHGLIMVRPERRLRDRRAQFRNELAGVIVFSYFTALTFDLMHWGIRSLFS